MRIGLLGYGKMGKMVEQVALAAGHTICHEIPDVYIDFSHPEAVLKHVNLAISNGKPIIIGTTGWDSELSFVKQMVENSSIAALYSPNFSLGVAFFIQLLKQARSYLSDYEVVGVEYHHSQKKDSPSGTAINIAHALEMKTPFTSVRYGRIAGKHEVIFDSLFDSITLTHESHNREGFARGAVVAAEWILDKKGWFTLDDMLAVHRSSHSPYHAV